MKKKKSEIKTDKKNVGLNIFVASVLIFSILVTIPTDFSMIDLPNFGLSSIFELNQHFTICKLFYIIQYSGNCLMWSLWGRGELITLTRYFYFGIYKGNYEKNKWQINKHGSFLWQPFCKPQIWRTQQPNQSQFNNSPTT